MLKFFILKLFLFSFLFSSTCLAEWKKITDGENVEIFLNFKEIKKKNDLIFFWQLNNYVKPLREKILSIKIYIKVDCKKNQFNPLVFSYHVESMGLGEADIKKNEETKWILARSKSKQKLILKTACIASFRT